MKNTNKFIVMAFLLIVGFANAQVGIGTATPDDDSVLDVYSTTKGLLLPRLGLSGTTSASPMTSHIAGMSVYNTATAGDVTPGYYINDGTKWIRFDRAETKFSIHLQFLYQ